MTAINKSVCRAAAVLMLLAFAAASQAPEDEEAWRPIRTGDKRSQIRQDEQGQAAFDVYPGSELGLARSFRGDRVVVAVLLDTAQLTGDAATGVFLRFSGGARVSVAWRPNPARFEFAADAQGRTVANREVECAETLFWLRLRRDAGRFEASALTENGEQPVAAIDWDGVPAEGTGGFLTAAPAPSNDSRPARTTFGELQLSTLQEFLGRAAYLVEIGEWEALAESIDEGRGLFGGVPEFLDLEAVAAEAQGRIRDAEAALRQVLAARPRDPGLLARLGRLQIAARESGFEQGIQLIRQAVEIDPNEPAYRDALGWAYLRAGQIEAARAALEKSFEQHFAILEDGYGLLENVEHLVAAARAGNSLPEIAPMLRRAAGRFESILASAEEPLLRAGLGWTYSATGDTQRAVASARQAAAALNSAAPPGRLHAVAWERVGDIYRAAGLVQESLDAYGRSRELHQQFGRTAEARRLADLIARLRQA